METLSLVGLLRGDGWVNTRVVFDAVLGWVLEPIGGNFSLVLRESTALAVIRYLRYKNAVGFDPLPLP